jgi:hypothetical protein
MKRFLAASLACLALVVAASMTVYALDDATVDKYIQDLKNSDPNIRAKAAYDLGCG